MVLFIDSHYGDRQSYVINDIKDFEPLFAKYGRIAGMVAGARTLRDAVEIVARYLSSHHMNAWVEDTELNKSLAGIGAAMGLGAALIGGMPTTPMERTPQAIEHKQEVPAFGTQPEDSFLWTVQQLESSGGKNTNHHAMKHGIHRGDTAIGQWGLMPNTIHEMLKRQRRDGKVKDFILPLEGMQPSDMKEFLHHNPHAELHLARTLARHVMSKQKGNEHKAAFSWLMGHNKSPNDITDKDLEQSDYVQKFKEKHADNPFIKRTIASMQKSEPFQARLKQWKRTQDEKARAPGPRDSTFSPDPGRQIDDYQPKQTSDIIKEYVRRRSIKKP